MQLRRVDALQSHADEARAVDRGMRATTDDFRAVEHARRHAELIARANEMLRLFDPMAASDAPRIPVLAGSIVDMMRERARAMIAHEAP